ANRIMLDHLQENSMQSFLTLEDRSPFFFFQAEDGIRDYKVTGVQTCALPIYRAGAGSAARDGVGPQARPADLGAALAGRVSRLCLRLQWRRAAPAPDRLERFCALRRREIGRASCRERVENTVVAGVLEEKRGT